MSISIRERLALARIGAELSRDDPRLAHLLSVRPPAHEPPGDAGGPDVAAHDPWSRESRHDVVLALVGVLLVVLMALFAALSMQG